MKDKILIEYFGSHLKKELAELKKLEDSLRLHINHFELDDKWFRGVDSVEVEGALFFKNLKNLEELIVKLRITEEHFKTICGSNPDYKDGLWELNQGIGFLKEKIVLLLLPAEKLKSPKSEKERKAIASELKPIFDGFKSGVKMVKTASEKFA
jgi:hypothetical protein